MQGRTTLRGGFADPPVQAAHAFRAALGAMARPGRIETVTGASAPAPVSVAAAVLLLTLCDGETPVFLAPGHDGLDIRDWIAFHIGAPLVDRAGAQFALGGWDSLAPLAEFPIGTPEYPDRSATLIVELDRLEQTGARLSGPGIRDVTRLTLPDPAALRANRALFPQGLDFYFTAGSRLAAVPRSTHVEVA